MLLDNAARAPRGCAQPRGELIHLHFQCSFVLCLTYTLFALD